MSVQGHEFTRDVSTHTSPYSGDEIIVGESRCACGWETTADDSANVPAVEMLVEEMLRVTELRHLSEVLSEGNAFGVADFAAEKLRWRINDPKRRSTVPKRRLLAAMSGAYAMGAHD